MGSDEKDKRQARTILIGIVAVLLLAAIASALLLPMLGDITSGAFSQGLGLKDAAIISFFVTTVLLVIFAITSGDGLIGEIQFVLGGFFIFFIIIWLMIAWIF